MAIIEPVSFWQAEPLSEFAWLRHGLSRRSSGVSVEAFDSLNTGLHVGDEVGAVLENRRRVAHAVGFGLESVVCAEQVHGAKVALINEVHAGHGAASLSDALPGADALVTNVPNLLLTLFFADCLPVFFADPATRTVAIAHAGWKGLAGGVLQNTMDAMTTAFGTNPADLTVAIGPGICARHFEVGPEVAAHFPDNVLFFPSSEKPHVDLFGAAQRVLQRAGVSPANITVSDDCTFALPDLYFSHRRDSGHTGRMTGIIGIN